MLPETPVPHNSPAPHQRPACPKGHTDLQPYPPLTYPNHCYYCKTCGNVVQVKKEVTV